MAWNLGGNMDAEIQRAILLKTLIRAGGPDVPPYRMINGDRPWYQMPIAN